MVDYYEILDIKRTASAVDIKSAYRRLARERHPDVNGGSDKSARDLALIALAYRTLSNPQERAHYDQRLCAVARRIRYACGLVEFITEPVRSARSRC